jgi:asparagine synthase (glutamine-hydrolysing)
MCGIAGFCNSDDRIPETHLLEQMIGMIRHRGPDAVGLYVDRGIGLAHARLSIIDLGGGSQPMHNEDGSVWISFNGEIFNYVELRQDLVQRGHRFRTQSDTEVILHLYEEEGEDCVHHLNGQWGFAIWDARQRKLFLSRDRLGVRPLFYTVRDGRLVFGSEIKAVFAYPGIARELDLAALDQIFTFWFTLPPRTMFKGICELPPGYSLVFKDGVASTYPHWQLDFTPGEPVAEGAAMEELRALLTDATRIRLRSDVPVGAYLSGGLDSTIITALINQFTGTRLRTFSIAFAAKELDESEFQDEAIAFLNTAHQKIYCDYRDIAEVFPSVIWHTEKTIIRAAPAPMYLLSRLVRSEDYKVVLTGEGADEIFGGYDIYKEAKIRRLWAAHPESKRRAGLLRRLYPYQQDLQKQSDAYLQRFFRASPDDLQNPLFSHLPRWQLTARLRLFFSDEARASVSRCNALFDLADGLPPDFGRWPPFCQAQYLETAFLLPGYILSSQGDRVGMAHAVEARHPFLDYRVVEFGAKLTPQLKMKVLNEKYILKRTFGHLLPRAVVDRPKQPYRAPDGKSFFTGFTPEYVHELLAPERIRTGGVFSPSAVASLLEKFRTGRAIGVKDNMAFIGILSTQLVIDQFVDHFAQGGRPCEASRMMYAAS